MEFTRINNDVNGNPRYVVHFFNLVSDTEQSDHYKNRKDHIESLYQLAISRARKIGGRKFHDKQFGGGICFQSYNLADLEKSIIEIRG